MKKNVLVVAPHPDDETLGCGGTLLRHQSQGDSVHWLILTEINEKNGFTSEKVKTRATEISKVAKEYGFAATHQLPFATTQLDQVSKSDLISQVSRVFSQVRPEVVYLPYRADIHSDHLAAFDAVASCTKWFRYPSVKRVLAYETVSETDFALDPDARGFRPNVFVNISAHLEKKIQIANIYASEMAAFPFPRSNEALRALAQVRGIASGFQAAEAFMLLKDIVE